MFEWVVRERASLKESFKADYLQFRILELSLITGVDVKTVKKTSCS